MFLRSPSNKLTFGNIQIRSQKITSSLYRAFYTHTFGRHRTSLLCSTTNMIGRKTYTFLHHHLLSNTWTYRQGSTSPRPLLSRSVELTCFYPKSNWLICIANSTTHLPISLCSATSYSGQSPHRNTSPYSNDLSQKPTMVL